ncbi:NAD(P)-dependent oxidoreductase [Streptomyces sp. NPDC002738]
MNLGVIGLGFMGSSLARSLLDAGHEVTVHDRAPEHSAPLVEHGARPAATSAQAAAGRDAVITFLPGPAQVHDVVLGADGVLTADPLPRIVMDCSTNSHSMTLQLAEACTASGVSFVDAPVTGRPPDSVFFVGGPAPSVRVLEPVFTTAGASYAHLGDAGAGTVGKLVNQHILFGTYLAALEGIVVAAKGGLDPRLLAEVIQRGPAASRPLGAVPEQILGSDPKDRRGAPLRLIDKDMGLLADLVADLDARSSTAVALRDAFAEALQTGLGDHHFGAVIDVLARRSGVSGSLTAGTAPSTDPDEARGNR